MFCLIHIPFSSIGFVMSELRSFQFKTKLALVMRRKDIVVSLVEDRRLLEDISEMSSVIIDYYSLVRLTASEIVHMTQEVRHKSNQLQTLLKISEQQLGQAQRKLLLSSLQSELSSPQMTDLVICAKMFGSFKC